MTETQRPSGMWMMTPAQEWREAFPTGNGQIGALAAGAIYDETIILNHDALWRGGLRQAPPDVSEHLPELRRLLAAGDYAAANTLYVQKLTEAGGANSNQQYHPACDLRILTDCEQAFTDYVRHVNFQTGQVTVSWADGPRRFERRLLASRSDDVIALCIRGDAPASVSAEFRLAPRDGHDLMGHGGQPLDWPFPTQVAAADEWVELRSDGSDGGQFGALARVIARGGSIQTAADHVRVSQADEVVVLVALYANEPAESALPRLREKLAALNDDYDELLIAHATVHQELFCRMGVDLDLDGGCRSPNELLLLEAYRGKASPELIQRLFDYGRYLLICSSRAGSLPCNLQGIWNGELNPPWNASYHNNENTQMCYWQALQGHLPEVTGAYFDYFLSQLEDYRTNARNLWGCRGIYLPLRTEPIGGFLPLITSHVIHWTGGAAWIAALFYDYWLFTGDREFLAAKAVPFLQEVAAFYEDFITFDADGCVLFAPSNSPENSPLASDDGKKGQFQTAGPARRQASPFPVCNNATMDFALAKEVLTNLCTACEVLGIDTEGTARRRALLAKMRPYEINEDGAIKEWMHSDHRDNYHHRHQSHLYPVFPGFEITPESDPELFEACRVAVEKRLCIGIKSQTGWSLAHMANIYARLGDGPRALECLDILARSCLGANLWTYHNDWRNMGITLRHMNARHAPFQIDANMGIAAAVIEMLLFSAPGLVSLLPALPDRWPTGRLHGARCRGGITVDVSWDRVANTVSATLTADTDQTVIVKFPRAIKTLSCDGADTEQSENRDAYREVTLIANTPATMTAALNW